MSLSTFTLLCSHPHHPSPELSRFPKLNLCAHETLTPHPPASDPRHPTFCPMVLTTLGTSYEWNQTVSICVWLISLRMTFSRIILFVAGVRISFLFKTELYSHIDGPHLCNPLMDTWVAEPG